MRNPYAFWQMQLGNWLIRQLLRPQETRLKTGLAQMPYNSTCEKDLHVRLWKKSLIDHVHEYRQIC